MNAKKIVAIVGATTLVATVALGGSVMAAEVEGKMEMPNIFRVFRGEAPADLSEKLGIDVSGMTKEEISEAMKAKQLDELKAALTEKGVEVSGLTEEQLYDKAKELKLRVSRFELRERGPMDGVERDEKFGIDVSGMTKEEIAEAIKAKQLESLKAALTEKGVDVSGLTEEQLYEKAGELGLRTGRLESKIHEPMDGADFDAMKTKQLEALKEILTQQGIDVSGLTDEEIFQKAMGNKGIPGGAADRFKSRPAVQRSAAQQL